MLLEFRRVLFRLPASMRAAPAFRERLSDFEAASTGSFSRRKWVN